MHKKSIVTVVTTALLALSVSYFALLAPTTAWFYQSQEDSYQFVFGDFDYSQSAEAVIDTEIKLGGTTRFADNGEILFDEVAHVVKVSAQNNGDLPAALNVTVEDKPGCSNIGLKYYVFKSPTELAPAATSTTAVNKGVFKDTVESMLEESMTLKDYTDFSDADTYNQKESQYDTYNAMPVSLLNAHNAQPLIFDANGALQYVYIVFWIEYGDVDSVLLENTTTTLDSYGVTITLTAQPKVAQSAQLSIVNSTAGALNPVLTVNGSLYSGEYSVADDTYTATAGGISVPANSTVVVSLPVGAKYRLAGTGMAFSSSGGTVGNMGNSVTVSLQAQTSAAQTSETQTEE